MGISGLLPLLKSIHRPIELKKYDGETFAVDAYGWLHRGAISCAMELAQGKPTRRYVDSVLKRVRMVQHFGITPYLVFDGDFLPSKAATETSRAKRREESRKAGEALMKAGNSKQAFFEFQKAIDISPEMACRVIEELKKLGLPYVVAPYEADAQMVYLERHGMVSGIISEDSDLLVFGAKRLLTKLDMQGHCIEINRRDFCACREISLTDWTDREFRLMAILSGCDYLEGIGNLGLKTAYRMIRKHKTLEKVVRMLQYDGKFKVHENYLASFRQAELTFLYQRVFCPAKQELVFLTEPASSMDLEGMRFIGHRIDHDVARGVANGSLSPFTKDPIILPLSPGKKRRASNMAGSNATGTASQPQRPSPIGKSIDQYFGKRQDAASQRIALGAMDPNCFTVDRQELAVLTQNGLVPRVFPLPRPYVDDGQTYLSQDAAPSGQTASPRLRRRQTEPLANLLQLGTGSTTNTAARRKTHSVVPLQEAAPKPMSNASPRPQKKARLNTDPASCSPAKNFRRSKYFSAFDTNEAPQKESRLMDPFLMSDDSLEEAMLTLSECPDWPLTANSKSKSTRASIQVFEDRQTTEAEPTTSAMEELSDLAPEQGTETSGHFAPVPQSDGIEVPASPVGSTARAAENREQTRATPLNRQSLSRFSYGPTTRMAHGLPTPESSFSHGSSQRRAAARKPNVLTPPSTAGRQSSSAWVKAPRASLSEFVEAADADWPERPRTSKKQRRSLGPTSLNPSFVPLPPADLAEVEALNGVQGSEDQIIPDSDGEDEEIGSDQRPKLNLSRFLCS